MLSVPLLNIVLSFVIAAIITWYTIPRIVYVSVIRKLVDKPGSRKIHKNEIPTLGGIGIFAGFCISLLLCAGNGIEHLSILVASGLIIFFMGQRDDLINLPPYKKLVLEIVIALLIVSTTGIKITTLHGILGIHSISIWWSMMITTFVIVLIMNSFNLIDGVDGLATSIAILCAVVYGIWFWMVGEYGYAVMAASVAGALCAFLPFNISHGRFKIFMGDTGSLTVGLMLAILTIRFNEINAIHASSYSFHSAPAITLGLFILPFFDAFRVFILRTVNNKNPFHADNNHLHHRLLNLGFTHIQTTLILLFVSILFTLLAIFLDKLGIDIVCLIMIVLATVFSSYSSRLEKKHYLYNNRIYNKKKNVGSYYKDAI